MSPSLRRSILWKVIFSLFHMNCEKYEAFWEFIITLDEINTVLVQ